jgi:hypothetical protein
VGLNKSTLRREDECICGSIMATEFERCALGLTVCRES